MTEEKSKESKKMKMIEWILRHPLVIVLIYLVSLPIVMSTVMLIIGSISSLMSMAVTASIIVAIIYTVIFLVVIGCIANIYQLTCSRCHQIIIDEERKFCFLCGGKVVATKTPVIKCKNGHKVKDRGRFCPKCGVRMEE
jgi:RNA polymerase subunit RPABC4/transcription elongation factor Spt4